jgi:hypothetical protein
MPGGSVELYKRVGPICGVGTSICSTLLERFMSDRLLTGTLWVLVMGMIAVTAGAGLILGYRGVFAMCAGAFLKGGITIGVGMILAGGSYLLARNGNDLMDR